MELRRWGRLLALSAGVTACVALVFVAGSVATSGQVVAWHPYAPPWDALSVERGERAIVLGITSAECGSRNLTVTVHESGHAVSFVVKAESPEYEAGLAIPCPAPRSTPQTVVLKRRLAGRQIEGQSATGIERFEVHGSGGHVGEGSVVPRLIGFSPRDASAALKRLSLHALITRPGVKADSRGLRRVAGQRPTEGTFLSRGSAVRLKLSR